MKPKQGVFHMKPKQGQRYSRKIHMDPSTRDLSKFDKPNEQHW